MAKPLIGLLDCNNFFVSCERLFRPDLIGKPVVVLSSNDGCVVSRSKEVKDIGVLMGVPYFQIKDIVKKHGITTFSSHFALYRDISRRVFAAMREELAMIEQYSIDEAFFTVEGDPEAVAWRLKQRVEQVVGIPVSIGVAATKTQAKYANQLAKKGNGVRVLVDSDWRDSTADIPLSDIWGVGGKLALRCKAHNVHTVADFLAADTARISQIFGVVGVRIQQELAGTAVYKIDKKSFAPQQSIMSSRSFKSETTVFEVLADAVAYHTRHVAAELRAMRLETKVIRVSIRPSRHGDYLLRGGTKEAVLVTSTSDSIELLQIANALLQSLFEPNVPYKKVGVVVSGLVSSVASKQPLLFGEVTRAGAGEQVMAVLDALNTRAGREVLLVGSRLRTKEWETRTELRSPAYTTKWKDIQYVKAK